MRWAAGLIRQKTYPTILTTIAALLFSVAIAAFASSSVFAASATWSGQDIKYNGHTYKSIGNKFFTSTKDPDKADTYMAYEYGSSSGTSCSSLIYFTSPPTPGEAATATVASNTYMPRASTCVAMIGSTKVAVAGDSNSGGGGGTNQGDNKDDDGDGVKNSSDKCESTAKDADVDKDGCPKAEPQCDAGAWTFMVCPFITSTQEVLEKLFGMIADLSYFQPLPLGVPDKTSDWAIYYGWSTFLTFANIMAVIGFLIIIFSQATSIGISSYGVKKLLPKIIIVMILMNLSYYLCAIAIDISNIIGVAINNVFNYIYIQVTDKLDPTAFNGGFGSGAVAGWFGGVVALAIIVAFFLIPVLITLLVIFGVLAARIAILTLLVIIAPLAFAAWILPNTEKYFKKWWSLFFDMLALYPVLMAVYGGATLAANILLLNSQNGDSTFNNILPFVALLIQVIPLIAIPFIIKGTSGTLGKVGDMINNKAHKWGGDAAHGALTDFRKRRMASMGARMATNQLGKDEHGNPLGGRGNRFKRGVGSGAAFIGGYKSRREFKHNQQDESVKRAHQNAMADQLLDNNSRFARRAAGVAGDEGVERVRATAIETVMRRGNERKENVEKLQGAFARLSPFAAQAYADSVENGQFSRAKLDQEISRRIADGQINHADAEELERVANFGSAMTPAAMAAATGSLARSGFLQTSHIRNAEKAIRDHKQMSGGEKQIALDQLAGNINDAAKQSGLAQHMRWGVVGGELLQNGQDFDQNEALSQLSAAEQQQYAELTYQAAGNIADMTEEQKLTAGNQAAALIAKGQAEVETRLGFQKLSSAASISRKAYKDGGSEAFAKTMNEDENFNTDVILTAAGARGQMSSQDRSALEEQARKVVEARGGVWDEVVNEARQKAGLFSRDSSGPGPTPPTGTQPTNPTPPTGP